MENSIVNRCDWVLTIYDLNQDNSVDAYYEEDELSKVLGFMKVLEEMNLYAELHCELWKEQVKKDGD